MKCRYYIKEGLPSTSKETLMARSYMGRALIIKLVYQIIVIHDHARWRKKTDDNQGNTIKGN